MERFAFAKDKICQEFTVVASINQIDEQNTEMVNVKIRRETFGLMEKNETNVDFAVWKTLNGI